LQILFSLIFLSNSNGQVISIDDFKIEEDKTLNDRERLIDDREFILSPKKDKILITGLQSMQSKPFSVPIEIATIVNGEKTRYEFFKILYGSNEELTVKWITNKEVLVEYPKSVYEERIINKLEEVKINGEVIIIRYKNQ